jgi:hypothetical protein
MKPLLTCELTASLANRLIYNNSKFYQFIKEILRIRDISKQWKTKRGYEKFYLLGYNAV